MKSKASLWIGRAVILLVTAAIVAGTALWGAGYFDLSFVPRPGSETDKPQRGLDTKHPGTAPAQTEPPSTAPADPSTQPPETEPPLPPKKTEDLDYSTLSALLEAGGSLTEHDFDGSKMVLAKNTAPASLIGVDLNVGTVTKSVIVRTETNTAGIALRETTGLVPVRGVVPYMGFVIVRTDGNYYKLLSASGELLNDRFPTDVELTFARNENGRPLVRTSKHYCYLTTRGQLEPAVYTPDQNALTFDLSADLLDRIAEYPEPFEEYVRIFTEVAEKDKVKGKDYFASWQKKLVEEGMDPATVLKMTSPTDTPTDPKPPKETEPPETEPEETEPPETEPEETEPEETEPEETEPTGTQPAEPEPQSEPVPLSADYLFAAPRLPDPEQVTEETAASTEAQETEPEETEPEQTEEPEPEKWYVLDEGMRWGYRNSSGKTVISPRFLYAYPFGTDGYAAVIRYNDKVETATLAFIDSAGKTKIDVAGKLLRDYTINDADVYDGYYPCLANDETALGSYYFDHGYVRVRHRMVLRTKIYNAYIDEEILIDKSGKEFPLPDGYKLIAYSCGILLLEKNGRYGYMNYRGEWVVQPVYTYAEPFSQGLGVIGTDGAVGMVDTYGNFVINPNYEFISSASHGVLSAYREKDGWTLFHVVKIK